jgi:hypothetical protein
MRQETSSYRQKSYYCIDESHSFMRKNRWHKLEVDITWFGVIKHDLMQKIRKSDVMPENKIVSNKMEEAVYH